MRITWDGIGAFVAMLFVTWLPMPRRAEGLRIGLFGAAMAYVFFDAIRGARPPAAATIQPTLAPPATATLPPQVELPPVTDENRLDGAGLLTGFSILRYLRRTGAVSDAEYEAKKAELLHRA